MAYCQECGSEVAENVAFCPYCGINLRQNASAADGGDDYSRENAAEVSHSQNKLDENKSGEAVPFEESAIFESNEAERQIESVSMKSNEFYANKNAFAAQIAKEVDEKKSDCENVEMLNPVVEESDLIQERQADTGVDIEKAKYENFVIEKESIRNESEITANEEFVFVSSEGEKVNPSHAQTESEMMSYKEAEIKEGLAVEEITEKPTGKSTTASDKNSSQIQNPDFHESKPDEPAGFSGSRVSGFENSEANAEA
ncbi:MAG TPA: zinc ribbon domain-containing protein, partial [Pyrinomonadaceae bacterium]|nr:zinc ribbon domain-containing protein [Pyrinomonadaceae bacterium]